MSSHPWTRWLARTVALACSLTLLPLAVPPAVRAEDPPSPTVLAVSAGWGWTCAIRTDSTLACWGWNYEGRMTPPDGTFAAVSAAWSHTCAIRTDGTLACWGWRDENPGQPTPPGGTFSAVSAGAEHTCGIRTDGTLACWGDDYFGETTPPEGTFSALSAGDWHNCAIRTDGTLACWGNDYIDEASLREDRFAAVSAGNGHTCAIRTDGTLVCWGWDRFGQATPPEGTFTAVSAGEYYACAIRTDGTLACWGQNRFGQATPPDGTFVAVSSGDAHTCAIRTDGNVVCWGRNNWGQVQPGPDMAPLAPWRVSTRVRLGWGARLDLFPAFEAFDVRYVRYSPGGYYGGDWHRWLTATTATRGTFRAAPGYTYCFEARGHDASGGVSAWYGTVCTSIPLDDRSLNRSAGWTARSGDRFYRGTALRTTTARASLSLPYVQARGIALVATTCPTCGTVEVYVGRRLLRKIRLTSPTRKDRVLIPVYYDLSRDGHYGTFRITVVSSGKKVLIDGLALFFDPGD